MYVNNGIASEEGASEFFICGFNKKHKNVNYELKPALLGQNDLLKSSGRSPQERGVRITPTKV
jgi:hypothetical protein